MNTIEVNIHPAIKYYVINSLCLLFGIKYTYDFKTIISEVRLEAIPTDAIENLLHACTNDSILYNFSFNSDKWKCKLDILNDILKLVTSGMKLIETDGGYRLFCHKNSEEIQNMLKNEPVYRCDKMSQWIYDTIFIADEKSKVKRSEVK